MWRELFLIGVELEVQYCVDVGVWVYLVSIVICMLFRVIFWLMVILQVLWVFSLLLILIWLLVISCLLVLLLLYRLQSLSSWFSLMQGWFCSGKVIFCMCFFLEILVVIGGMGDWYGMFGVVICLVVLMFRWCFLVFVVFCLVRWRGCWLGFFG